MLWAAAAQANGIAVLNTSYEKQTPGIWLQITADNGGELTGRHGLLQAKATAESALGTRPGLLCIQQRNHLDGGHEPRQQPDGRP